MSNVVNICCNQPFARSEVVDEFKEVEYSNISAVTLFLFVGVYNIWLLYAPFLYMSFLYFIKHNECTKKNNMLTLSVLPLIKVTVTPIF